MPRSVINKLKIICNPLMFHQVKDINGIVTLECNESDASAVLKKVSISGFSDLCSFKLDKLKLSDSILKNGHVGRKACDALAFGIVDDVPYALIFDMKSSTPSDESHIFQLRSGLLGSKYILELLSEFEGIASSVKWNYRYFIFHCKNNKRETLPEYQVEITKNILPNKPHIFETNNQEVIPVRKLLGMPLITSLS
ncbi:hypothetical protein F908_02329 [Acinetobacter sp. NIPH 284]|uniref:hypothetical protein n=1 Tax=Acinetobacter sp. NIPH 284 TaxID=1217704 RepID=UPI0002CF21DA|nr:hypothetical protein [Acinetobacter sp. NIPH 284]ENW80131.1 hypothetical protein F908_02329 [Acinetobacter sp. NIPH 284]